MDKEKQSLYRTDVRLYDVLCTVVNDCIMKEARRYGMPEDLAKKIILESLREITRKVSHTCGPCVCVVPSYKKMRKWYIYKECLTKKRKDVAQKYDISLVYVFYIIRTCVKELQKYAGQPWDLLPWYIRLAEV